MPNDRTPNKEYSILKYLSTEELEQLLCQDFDTSDAVEPDTNYIMAIMGVIRERETMTSPNTGNIVDAAWNDFCENYQGQHTANYAAALRESKSSHLDQTSMTQSPRRKLRFLRYVLIAAMVGVLLCGAASAFGFNVFQALANWTAETFGFTSTAQTTTVEEEDPYKQLRSIVEQKTDISIIPRWAPDGAVQSEDISIVERTDGTRISSVYDTHSGRLNIRVMLYDEIPSEYDGSYQKDDNTVTSYTTAGVTHYLMSNNGICIAVWTNENIEVMLQGDLSNEDLEKMIDSIYKE